jgi:cobalt-zinc-cadmium efflux system membrane fusion protein
MHHRKLLSGSGLFFALLFLYSCGNHTSSVQTSEKGFCLPDSLLKNLVLDTLRTETGNNEITLSGKISFNEDNVSKIFPLVSGHVTYVKISLGDYVEKGKVLAVIESSDMANYYNEYKSSLSELAVAKKNLEVTGSMRNSGVSSEKDFLVAQNEYQKAQAEYNKIKEVLKINGSSVVPNDSTGSGYVIKSPISGFVVEKNITAGMDLRPDANESLFTISDLKSLWATANVYETDISKIKTGSDADIVTLSYPDEKFSGKVERISNLLDPETKLMSIKIGLKNQDYKLKPGMFARISVRSQEGIKLMAVKTSSLIFEDNKCFVLRFRNKCDISLQRVNIYKSINEKSYFESDSLKEGDLTIARDGLFVYTALINQ